LEDIGIDRGQYLKWIQIKRVVTLRTGFIVK